MVVSLWQKGGGDDEDAPALKSDIESAFLVCPPMLLAIHDTIIGLIKEKNQRGVRLR